MLRNWRQKGFINLHISGAYFIKIVRLNSELCYMLFLVNVCSVMDFNFDLLVNNGAARKLLIKIRMAEVILPLVASKISLELVSNCVDIISMPEFVE